MSTACKKKGHFIEARAPLPATGLPFCLRGCLTEGKLSIIWAALHSSGLLLRNLSYHKPETILFAIYITMVTEVHYFAAAQCCDPAVPFCRTCYMRTERIQPNMAAIWTARLDRLQDGTHGQQAKNLVRPGVNSHGFASGNHMAGVFPQAAVGSSRGQLCES